MSTAHVWILGGHQTDFARNFTRAGRDFPDLTAEVVDRTLISALGEMFARQGRLGAMPASVNDGLWDTPASRHEAACGSGSVATLAPISETTGHGP